VPPLPPFYAIILDMDVSILIDEEFADKLDSAWLERVMLKVFALEKVPENAEIGLLITGQSHIQELNKEYLGEDRPTDVLSFSMRPGKPEVSGERKEGEEPVFILPPDGINHLGEVIVSYPQAELQAKEHGHSVEKEMAILVIHGVLHILGYDHAEPDEEREMQRREAEILESLKDEVK